MANVFTTADPAGATMLEGWSRKADIAHEKKEARIASLQKMTAMSLNSLGNQQALAQAQIEEGNRKKGEVSRQVDINQQTIDGILVQLKTMQVNMDAIDQKAKRNETSHTELRERMELLFKQTDKAVADKYDRAVFRIKAEEEARLLLSQEFQMALSQREKILNQTIQTEIRGESAARLQILTDIARLSEQIKDLQIQLQSDTEKLKGEISSSASKTSGQFAETADALNAERVARERQLSACRNDVSQRCSDIKQFAENKVNELARDAKEATGQLTFVCDTLREDITRSSTQRDKMVDDVKKVAADSLAEVSTDLSQRILMCENNAGLKFRTSSDSIQEVRELLVNEAKSRERSINSLQEAMAEEHFRREQDESTIINLMEGFIRQVKETNAASA